MTCRDLIIYILKNNLEDEVILEEGIFTGLMTAEEAAIKFGVGVGTVKAWFDCGILTGTKIGNSIFFLKDISKQKGRDES